MAITYTTTINNARVSSQDELENVIKEVDVTIKGQDGTCTFELPTTVKFGPADPDDFTDFDDLTEAELIAWVEAQESIEPVKAHIALVLEKEVAKAALAQKPLPWQPAPPPMPEPPMPQTTPAPAE